MTPWRCTLVAAALALLGCEPRESETTQLQPEPLPPPSAAPQKAEPKLAFALVSAKTSLHGGPNETTESFRPEDRLPGGVAHGGAVLFAIDGEQPPTTAWVRLVATERRGRCGYGSMPLDAPVYVKRADLMRTLSAPATIDGPEQTRIELQPGVALRPTGKRPTEYVVTTREVRVALDLKDHPVTTVLGDAALQEASGPAPAPSPLGAPTPKKYGVQRTEALLVGAQKVRLSTKHPPRLTAVEGHDALAMLDTPCVDVVGVEVREPDPHIARRAAIMKQIDSKSILGLLASDPGGFASVDDVLAEGGDLDIGGHVPGGVLHGGEPEPGGGGRAGGLARPGGGGTADLGPRRKTQPTLTLGTTHTTKGLDDAVVRRIVRGRQSRLLACYERGLARDQGLRGHVLLGFTVQLDGRVGSARSEPKSRSQPSGTDLPDASVVSCMVRALGGITFPRPNGDRPVKAKIRLSLRP